MCIRPSIFGYSVRIYGDVQVSGKTRREVVNNALKFVAIASRWGWRSRNSPMITEIQSQLSILAEQIEILLQGSNEVTERSAALIDALTGISKAQSSLDEIAGGEA